MLIPVIDWGKLLGKGGLKVALIGLGVALGATGIGLAGYYFAPEPAPKPPPPVETSTLQQTTEYVASEDFNRLPMDQRVDWINGQVQNIVRMDDQQFVDFVMTIDKETRDRIRANMAPVMRERARRNANTYHKLPESEKKAFVDAKIDEMEQFDRKGRKIFGREERRGGLFAARSGARSGSGRAAHASASEKTFRREERMAMHKEIRKEAHHFMVKESPDQRARTVTFINAIGKRRVERGVSRLFGGRTPKR